MKTILVYAKKTDDLITVEYADAENVAAVKIALRARYGDAIDIVVKGD